MWTHPGKKLLFMGGEIGQGREWSHDGEIDWDALRDPGHAGLQHLVGDLNRLYANAPALHATDAIAGGFRWLIGNDQANSVFAFERRGAGEKPIAIVVNMTPTPRHDYRIGVSHAGRWREMINTDASIYGGSNLGNAGRIGTAPLPAHGHGQSLNLLLPPLATLVLGFEG
jgi:1,4-alpha-glucan branching enzyme